MVQFPICRNVLLHTFYVQQHSIMYENVQNSILSLCRNLFDLGLWRSVSAHHFETVSLFFVVIFATNFEMIFKDHLFCSHIINYVVILRSDISMSNDSKGLRPIKDFCPSSQSGTSRKKIVSTKKVYEIDHTETCL